MKRKKRMSDAPRIHLASLGCAKNLVDSERLLGRLATAGALVGADAEDADVIIVNTCGFIAPAVEESLQVIGDYVAMKRASASQRLYVMGCLVERDASALRETLPEVDGFFGIEEQDRLVAAIGLHAEDDGARLLLTPAHSAYLRISDGCDNRCSYCTIPAIRGPFRSRPETEIFDEARQLVERGALELNLIGQDTSLYGADRRDGIRIGELLRRLDSLDGLRWLRLLYTHPAHFEDALIDAYARLERLIPYVDLPLQHLNDDILSRMGRKVTSAQCLSLIDRLRRRVEDVVLRTTFIVGFPGETDAQFDELLDAVREIRFDHIGAFAFSPEVGTPAYSMARQVPDELKAERVERLMLAQQEIVRDANRGRIGETAQVLIEEAAAEEGLWIGRTVGQAPDVDSVTFVRGANVVEGTIVSVRIVGFEDYDLVAEAD